MKCQGFYLIFLFDFFDGAEQGAADAA